MVNLILIRENIISNNNIEIFNQLRKKRMTFRSPTIENSNRKLKFQLTSTRHKPYQKSKINNNECSESNMISFRNENSERKSTNHSPNYLNLIKYKSSKKIVTLETDRKRQSTSLNKQNPSNTALDQLNNEEKCYIYLVENNKKAMQSCCVKKIGDLITKLNGPNKNIASYVTIPTNLVYDFYLTQLDRDGTFLNGQSLYLSPYFKTSYKKVDIRSFEIIKCIGAGGFSKVFLVKFKEDGKFYAMKLIDKHFIVENKKKGIVENERNIMQEINHPFLIEMKFAFQSADFLIFVLEYCPGGELFNFVKKYKKIPQDVAKFYIIQILLGLQYLHDKNIIYRDIKPENILIGLDGHVKIADFGLAKPNINRQSIAHSFCGSPEYMAPEMIMKIGHSFPVDFYCLGALLYELVTGLPPFYSKNTEQIYESVLTEELTFPRHAVGLSTQCKNLIRGLLTKKQKHRLGSLFGVKQILAHPWFGKIKKSEVLQKKLNPPINIDNINTIKFDFENLKENTNNDLLKLITGQQKEEKLTFKKLIKKFQFDYRVGQQQENNPQSELTNRIINHENLNNLKTHHSPFKNLINENDKDFVNPFRKLKKYSSGTLKFNQTLLVNSGRLKRVSKRNDKQRSPYNVAF